MCESESEGMGIANSDHREKKCEKLKMEMKTDEENRKKERLCFRQRPLSNTP